MRSLLLLIALAGLARISATEPRPGTKTKFIVATCIGADPCKACKNCKYCKRCAKGGKSCGICKK